MHKLTDSILDKFSMDFLRNQVLKNAYGNDDTVIAGLDPRVLLIWYLFFGLVPWFINDVVLLLGLFLFVVLTTRAARIAPLVLFLFCVGVFTQTGYLLVMALFFGGDSSLVAPLLVMTLKVAVVSLASVTVFSGLDPDRLASGTTGSGTGFVLLALLVGLVGTLELLDEVDEDAEEVGHRDLLGLFAVRLDDLGVLLLDFVCCVA